MLIHQKCNAEVRLNVSAMYSLECPSYGYSSRGITSSTIEIVASSSRKRNTAILICPECEKEFSSRDDFEELYEVCNVCQERHNVSRIRVTEYIPLICEGCLNTDITKIPRTSIQYRYLEAYGTYLRNSDNPTLLTILMKK